LEWRPKDTQKFIKENENKGKKAKEEPRQGSFGRSQDGERILEEGEGKEEEEEVEEEDVSSVGDTSADFPESESEGTLNSEQ